MEKERPGPNLRRRAGSGAWHRRPKALRAWDFDEIDDRGHRVPDHTQPRRRRHRRCRDESGAARSGLGLVNGLTMPTELSRRPSKLGGSMISATGTSATGCRSGFARPRKGALRAPGCCHKPAAAAGHGAAYPNSGWLSAERYFAAPHLERGIFPNVPHARGLWRLAAF